MENNYHNRCRDILLGNSEVEYDRLSLDLVLSESFIDYHGIGIRVSDSGDRRFLQGNVNVGNCVLDTHGTGQVVGNYALEADLHPSTRRCSRLEEKLLELLQHY